MACSRCWNWSPTARRVRRWLRGPRSTPSLRKLVQQARAQGVSFATRGNLLLLAPPLVITENELTDALGLLDRLLGELEWT